MTIHLLFTVQMLRPFYVFSDVLDFIEAECSIYQNVQYFIRSKNCVLNFTAVRYSLDRCSEMRLCLKRQFSVHVSPVFLCTGVHGSKKNMPPSSSYLSLVTSLLWRAFQQKLYRQDFRDVDRLKCVLLHCSVW